MVALGIEKLTSEYLNDTFNAINICFSNISKNNIKRLIGRSFELSSQKELQKLFSLKFFWPIHRSHSLVHHFTTTKADTHYLPGPCSILPLPDEKNIFIATPIHEDALGWNVPEIIPSKEYMINSYSWENIIQLDMLESEVSLYLKSNGHDELLKILSNSVCADNYDFEVIFFNTLKDRKYKSQSTMRNPGKVKREILSTKEFLELLTDTALHKRLTNDLCFDYFAYKKCGDDTNQNSQKSSHHSKPAAKKTNNTFVLFVDSLDINSLIELDYISRYPNIKKLLRKAVNYRNFTSSAAWTFPCLYSIYSGIPPYWSFSIFPSRVDPIARWNRLGNKVEMLLRPNCLYSQIYYNYQDYSFNHGDDYLSRKLRRMQVGQFSLRQSSNHFWNHALMHSFDQSIENYSSYNLQNLLDTVLNEVNNLNKNDNTIFIDLDTLHQNLKPKIPRSAPSHTTNLDWFKRNITKEERLSGDVYDDNEINKYLDKLSLIDHNIGIIMEKKKESDSIILFSDNGSDVLVSNKNYDELNSKFHAVGTSLTYPKIMKPTLLIDSPCLTSGVEGTISEELVSTLDLHSIILHVASKNNPIISSLDEHSPILPKSIGGDKERTKAFTFSVTNLRYQERIFELVTRSKDGNIDYNISDPIGDTLPSLKHPRDVPGYFFK